MSNTGIDVKLISASAGTGKTTRLVTEIVQALDLHPATEIVAVTFTKAAVRDLNKKIKDRLADSPKKDSISDLTISTIHSFFAQILREQSMKLNISPNFEILGDNAAVKIIFWDICKDVISKKVTDSSYEEIFLEYSFAELMKIMETLESRYAFIRKNVTRTYNDFLKLERDGEARKLYQVTGTKFVSDVVDVIIGWDDQGKAGTLTEARQLILQDIKALRPALESFLKEAVQDKFNRNDLKKVCAILRDINFPSNVRVAKGLEALNDAYKKLKSVSKEVAELKIGEDFVSEQAARILVALMKIFNDVHQEFSAEKKKMEALDYNDIEIMAYDLVHNYPQVAEYYRTKYSYVLVDEFQDTNHFQRDTLFKISKKFFLVGDAKQSIYRFRNADVRVFVDTQRKFLKGNFEELKDNYRSHKNIVDTVNEGFEVLFDQWTGEKQSFDPEYMKMDMGKKDSPHPDDGIVKFLNVGDPETKSASVELEALCTVNLIKEKIKSGRKFDDFAILFRTRSNIPVFEKFLIKNEIPYVVWGDMDKEEIIKRLTSLFGFILNPYNNFYLLETIKLPRFYISDQDIYKFKKENEYIWDSIKARQINSFFDNCEALGRQGGNFTEYVSQILSYSEFIPSIAALYPGRETGLEEMILRIAQDVEEMGGGLSDFMEFLSVSSSDKNDLEVKDAVRLMTVHASKGLDFPVVILPSLHNAPGGRDLFAVSTDGDISLRLRDRLEHDRRGTPYHSFIKEDEDRAELAESKRVFYVASTRAKEELYFIGNFEGALNKGIKGDEANAIKSERWIDWASYIFSSKIENVAFKEGENRIQTRILREIIKVAEPYTAAQATAVAQVAGAQAVRVNRYSVSMIRDFAISAQLMLDNMIKKDVSELFESSEQTGVMVHELLENYVPGVSDMVDSFVSSDIGKKIFEASNFKAEHSFLAKISSDIVIGRIDRMNIYDDRVWVIDYKTGVDEKMMEGYKAQMACYLYYASQAYPGKNIYGSIIDVTNSIEKVYKLDELRDLLKDILENMNKYLKSY